MELQRTFALLAATLLEQVYCRRAKVIAPLSEIANRVVGGLGWESLSNVAQALFERFARLQSSSRILLRTLCAAFTGWARHYDVVEKRSISSVAAFTR